MHGHDRLGLFCVTGTRSFQLHSRLPVRTTTLRTATILAETYAAIVLTCDRSTLIPGPIVVEIVTRRTLLPFAEAGLALSSDIKTALALSINCSAPKDALPTGTWTIP